MSAPTIRFLGAAHTVTGSRFLIESGGSRVLVDCGMFQGIKEVRKRNWEPFPEDIQSIDAVVLTHAHIDHTGYLPRLVKLGYNGPVYATPATNALLGLLLPDAGYLQEEEARYLNKRGATKHSPALPLYTQGDAQDALKLLRTLDYDEPLEVAKGITATMHPSGHILGAAFIQLDFEGRRLVASGDLGSYEREVMKGPSPIPKDADYILAESTYGGRSHPEDPVREQLRKHIAPILAKGGVVVIPSFAIGRSTVLLYHLRKLQEQGDLPDVPVYLDSPMATDSVKLYIRYGIEHNLKVEMLSRSESCPIRPKTTRLVRTPEESKKLNTRKGPFIVVSASGMATGGRILHHLSHRAPDQGNLILLVGYQAQGTRGRRILEGAETMKIHGEEIAIRAHVASIGGFSAHGDADDIIRWLKTASKKPKKVFLVHGEDDSLRAMKERVEGELHFPTSTPAHLQKYPL